MSINENDDAIEIKGIDYFTEQDLSPDYAYVIKASDIQRRLDHKNCFIIIEDQPDCQFTE
ncbi:hypothetical protein [Acetobacterium wieringae]|uniref:hypothetical protein n=1 Tax=Acetobacterium wieringae TaxID=52694 RepID=UPI0026EFE99F|nr:hypothetical protein [Acetobacterium wieringae]